MLQALSLIVQVVAGVTFPALIVSGDLRRLQGARLERAWPDATVLSAALAFGPLCLVVHFVRTRRSWGGLLLGLAWTVACAGALLLLALLSDSASDWASGATG